MKRRIQVYIEPDTYEIVFDLNIIERCTRYIGESQIPQECDFSMLPTYIQDIIISASNDK
jgi:hypothetical protein